MKKFGMAMVFVALAAAIGVGVAYFFTNNNPSLSEKEAQAIALKDAGIKEQDAQGLRVQLENEDGMKYYDVSFKTQKDNQTVMYDYDIDAETGAIYGKEAENHGTVVSDAATNAQDSQAQGEISGDEAKAVALEHAGVNEADVLRLHTEYEHEATGNEWNVEFETATTEYEYDISASDGRIVQSSNEPRD